MGFFQSLKQDLSEAVGELIGEEDALEGVENEEGAASEIDAVEAEEPQEIEEELQEDITEDVSVEDMGFSDEANTAEELNALLKDVIQPADEAGLSDELPAEDNDAETPAGNVDAEAAAMALFDSLSDEEGLSFADDSNEVDLAEKLAEEAYKAELLAEEADVQEKADADMDAEEAIASMDDIDINKMLENIQGELNAVQEESFQADGPAADVAAALDSVEISPEPQAEDEMMDGQMSLEEMMAMAESLTKESFAAEEPAAVEEPAAEEVVSETAAESVADVAETAAVQDAEETAAESEAAMEPVASEIVPDAAVADVPAETAAEELIAEASLEPQNEESEAEPAKEKKAKKTSRKKKAKADVSAAIGAEELAGRVFSDETAHLSDGMMIRGNIISDGNMEVAGEIDGNIDILGKLNVSGTINGNTKAGELYAEGAEINGNIECSGSVKVGQGAVIIGDVAGTSAVIAGAVKGNIDVHGPVILADSAIVMGDIRSASVQISNGAAVEGMCSQIYAEVSPKNFFKDLRKAK
jgi:cytoskeletal protein CcmA (bactofilin family)